MIIHFYGAARAVTGSQFLLEIDGRRLLLECGMYQGHRDEAYARNHSFAFDPRSVDAAILSHAHIDHSGNLPNLVKNGYAGPIYATLATTRLADVMLRDSGHIQEADAEYVNFRNRKRGLPPIKPIYTIADAEEVKRHFRPVEYNREFQPFPGVTARLVEAGHILGSAAICLDIAEPGRKPFRFWFSGDIGRRDLALIRDPVLPQDPDILMMECTYGDTRHRNDPEEAYDRFRDVVRRTIQRRGKLIIPAFAVGRTQELVYALHQFIQNGEIPPIPIFVDSPLAVEASRVFHQSVKDFDAQTQAFIKNNHEEPLVFDEVTYIASVEASKALNDRDDPMVIISASGMAEVGRILHHIKNNVENPRNTIAIVSWQAPGTLGRRLADGAKEITIFGDEYRVEAEVVEIDGFSAHAGQPQLLEYALANRDTTRQIFLVHGEEDAAEALMRKIEAAGGPPVSYPDRGESMEV